MSDLWRLDLSTAQPAWTARPPSSRLPSEHLYDRPVLLVVASGPLGAPITNLGSTRAGKLVFDALARNYTEVLGSVIRPDRGPAEIQLPAGATPVDVLAVDVASSAVAGPGLARVRRLVIVGSKWPTTTAGWTSTFTVIADPAGRSTSGQRCIAVPRAASGPELLSMEPVARSLLRWLADPAPGRDSLLPPWRESQLVIIDDSTTVELTRTFADLDPPVWLIYRWPGSDSEQSRYTVLLPTELASLLPHGSGSETESLGDFLLPARHHQVVSLDEAPAMVADGGTERRQVVSNGNRVVAVVPHVDDVLAAANPPRRILATSQPVVASSEPPDQVRQFLHARGPESIRVGAWGEIEVQISGSDLGRQAGVLGTATGLATGVGPLSVRASGRRAVGVIEVDDRDVPVQAAGRSAELSIVVEGLRSGLGSVDISLLQGPDEIARVSLAIVVGSEVDAGRSLQVGTDSGNLWPQPRRRGLLCVDDDGNGRLQCWLSLPDGRRLRDETRQAPSAAVPVVKRILATVDRMWSLGPSMARTLDAELRGHGVNLFRAYLPPSIRSALWDVQEQLTDLEVASNLPMVPWELLHLAAPNGRLPPSVVDGRYFLGQRGLTRSLPNVSQPTLELHLGRNQAVVVEPSYLAMPDLDRLIRMSRPLLRRLGALVRDSTLNAVTTLLDDGGFDLFHFSGHGGASPDGIAQYLVLEDSRVEDGQWVSVLNSQTVSGIAGPPDRRPLVFLNGCQTGLIGSTVPGQGGFAEAFLQRGAGAFIGSQWRIEDTAAATYAEMFYDLLIDQGATLSEAAAGARQLSVDEWSATSLAYAVYGDPDARIVTDSR